MRAGMPSLDEIREVVERAYGWELPAHFNYALGGTPDSISGATAIITSLIQVVDGRRVRATRLIHKAIHHDPTDAHWGSSAEPGGPMYWKREALAYTSGLLGALHEISAPRCWGVFERDDATVGIWLEDVGGDPALNWSLDRFARAARQLGRTQGEFMSGRSLPDQAWLARGWLRASVARREPSMVWLDEEELWEHPLARATLTGLDRELWATVWSDRTRLLAALDALPHTLSHNDFWPRNLFGSPDGGTIAIDWALVGIGALGADVANLVATALLDGFVATRHARALFDGCLRSYLRGVREAGWRGDARAVVLGVNATIAVKFVWMLPHMLALTRDHGSVIGDDVRALYTRRAHTLLFLEGVQRRALSLL